MIISDGTTELTYLGTQVDDSLIIEQSSTTTGSGSSRTIRAGKRFFNVENIRITGAQYKTLTDLLMNGASEYYYTPTHDLGIVDTTDFPMPVKIGMPSKISQHYDGVKYYILQLTFSGVDYL